MGVIPLQLRDLPVTLAKSPRPSPDMRFVLLRTLTLHTAGSSDNVTYVRRGLAEGGKVALFRKQTAYPKAARVITPDLDG